MYNIFTVNAGVAGAYKRAFDICEKRLPKSKGAEKLNIEI